jgi:transcriptional regulator with XRE-family HTH domain
MKKKQLILPQHEQILEQLGQNFKLARKRRGLSMQQMAERTDCSRNTIRLIENGNPGSSIGVCFRILKVLGLQNDLLKLAQDDILGRKIQDLELLQKYNRYA